MAGARRRLLGIDIGGTFTDLVLLDPDTGRMQVEKVLTTPEEIERGALEGVRLLRESGVEPARIGRVIHATTVATNALIEGKGAVTGLLTTTGFRDVIEIGREIRYDLYDLAIAFPPPIVPRARRLEVDERVGGDGAVLRPLDPRQVEDRAARLAAQGVTSIAIGFLHAYANPGHERATAKVIAGRHPGISLSLSSEVAPEIREYERFVTTAVDAYVKPLVRGYLDRLEQMLRGEGFRERLFIMLSNGGISAPAVAGATPVKMLESGPAAGTLAAAFYSGQLRIPDLVAFDMGGTTAKISLVEDGRITRTREYEVARVHRFKRGSGYPLRTSAIELVEIGAGGGSIARVDDMGLLKVGPDSAGAFPGPACYGRGGAEPTVTDALLLLGYLNPAYFLGGKMALDVEAAEKAVQRLAEKLGTGIARTAAGIYDVITEKMAAAVRMHLAEKGRDPRVFSLFAFGGAGPLHAWQIARRLGIRRVICPLGAGATAAYGALVAPPAMDLVRSYQTDLTKADWARVNRLFEEMQGEGRTMLAAAGVRPRAVRFERTVDLRYALQGYGLSVTVPPGRLTAAAAVRLRASFEKAHAERYGRRYPDLAVEAVNWRVWAYAPALPVRGWQPGAAPGGSPLKGKRRIYLPDARRFVEVPVYDRYRMPLDRALRGPAILEERESTVVVGPGCGFRIDPHQNLVMSLEGT